jgi:hypothetical protein
MPRRKRAVQFRFDSLEPMTAALSGEDSTQIRADVANYTNITRIVQTGAAGDVKSVLRPPGESVCSPPDSIETGCVRRCGFRVPRQI